MSENDSDPSSPICFLAETSPSYGFAKPLTAAEIVALLDRLLVCARAGEDAQAESRIRESLPLIADASVRAVLAAMAETRRVAVAELERLRSNITTL
jgi:hypothetical protein